MRWRKAESKITLWELQRASEADMSVENKTGHYACAVSVYQWDLGKRVNFSLNERLKDEAQD